MPSPKNHNHSMKLSGELMKSYYPERLLGKRLIDIVSECRPIMDAWIIDNWCSYFRERNIPHFVLKFCRQRTEYGKPKNFKQLVIWKELVEPLKDASNRELYYPVMTKSRVEKLKKEKRL